MKDWAGKDRDWAYISRFFRENSGSDEPYLIDERTWEDLDLGDVFRKIDRTGSSVGQALLYNLMRTPIYSGEEYDARVAAIRGLTENVEGRARIRRILTKLGFQREGELYGFFSHMSGAIEDKKRHLFVFLGLAALLSLATVAVLGLRGLIFVAAATLVNFIVHFRYKAPVEAESPSFGYLHRLLAAGRALSKLDVPGVGDELVKLRALLPGMKRLERYTRLLFPRTGFSGDIGELIFDYVKIFFLLEVCAYFFAHNEMIRRIEELKSLYALVGKIDALAGVAAFRSETPSAVTPEITPGRFLAAEDMVHPLLDHPVSNSILLDGRGMILTGSNMSGKSTFLRTLGVNQVLATSLCTAFARSFRTSFFHTVSSITNRDSISRAESHYFVEAKRLLAILTAREDQPSLVIIDEILSGTNSQERISASIRILKYMAERNCLVVAATHDREIGIALDGVFSNRHFTHFIDEHASTKGIEFDYKLKEGVVEHGNAVKLLSFMGFPKEIAGGME